jgi:hypothetical protein
MKRPPQERTDMVTTDHAGRTGQQASRIFLAAPGELGGQSETEPSSPKGLK